MAQLDELLVYLKDNDGSDLHLAAGLEPRIRAKGRIRSVEGRPPLADGELRTLLEELAMPRHWNEYVSTNDVDFAYGLEGVARFRANYFVQENGAGAVFRIIPEEIISLGDLHLPDAVGGLAHLNEGLVLVTGPTGSGKSTTLAAIINEINTTYEKHVVTIEDPVEFVHQNRSAVFSHREVGLHTLGFEPALRSAIRQDADVVLVGEMRERETIDRIIDAFPADEQNMVRISLSESLAGIVSQLLLPTADGKGRCAANEILLKTPGLPNVIRENNTQMLYSIIQAGRGQGMQAMDDVLWDYCEQGRITARDAYMKATDKARFEPLLEKG